MGLRANIWKEIAETTLAEVIDIQRERLAEPGDTDDLPASADGFESLEERLMTGQTLPGTAASAFENDISAVAPGQLVNGFHDIAGLSIERVVRAELARDVA